MASIIKQGFLFVLVCMVGFAQASQQSSIINPAQCGTSPQLAPPRAGSAIPLSVPFIQNRGQIADSQVLFYARTFGGTVCVTAEGQLVYALLRSEDGGLKRTVDRGPLAVDGTEQTTENGSEPTANSQQPTAVHQMAVIRETLVDADLTALPSGAERSGTVVNSFIGNDPSRWQANIPAFSGVQFGDIYEGIALEVRATGDNVEKIFTVAPGADPARIALRLAGAEGVSITPSGELEARTALGPVRFTAPVAYQKGAAGERQGVSVAYALEGDQIGFCVGAFDAARPLVIDPMLASTFIGGSSNNTIRAMALDSQTNVFVAGYTASMDFPAINGYDTSWNGGSYDGFIAKFDPNLTNLLVATYLGGSGEDRIMAMAVNTNNGAVYLAGYTASRNFPLKNPLYGTSYKGGGYDAFVSVLDNNLATLTSSTYLGGTNTDMAYALALGAGPTPDVFVAGLTASTNFPIASTYGIPSFQTNLSRATGATAFSNDAFVVRFNSDLSVNLASTYLGGTNDDGAYGIALDTNGFVYVAGYTTSANFPMTNGAFRTKSGLSDAFVSKLPITLTNLNASTFLGGTSNDVANGIAVAPYTNIVCVVGYTYSANFPRNPSGNIIAPGYINQFMGGKDAFLTCLDLALSNVLASTYLGGSGDDEATAVIATSSATTNMLWLYVAGWTTSSNFPVTTNAFYTTANGGRDAFVSYFSAANTLQASTYLGGTTNDSAYAMALQADSFSLFVAGATASTNFPATVRAYDNDRTGRTNDYGFVTKLGSGLAYGTEKWQVTPGSATEWCSSPSLGWNGTIYVGGGSNLYAYDANGNKRWQLQVNGQINGNDSFPGSTPAIARDGTIYFGTRNGYLQAVKDNGTGGTVLWTDSFSGGSIYSSPAIGNDGTIYFGSQNSRCYAVSSNGTIMWTNTDTVLPASSIFGSPAIDTNGRIYVVSSSSSTNSKLFVINTNGTTLTNWSLSLSSTYSSPMIGSNGWVYVGSGANLYGFNPNSGASQTWATAGAVYSSPAMDSNGVIYVGSGNNLYAFNTNTAPVHTWATAGQIMSSPAITEDGTIYVVDSGYLYAFGSDGSTKWVSFYTVAPVSYQSPLLRRDGTIYFTDDLNLYALCGKSREARSPWSAHKHDALRTGNAAFDAAAILVPTGLVAQGTYSNSSVLVSWTWDPNADYYDLYRGTNGVDTPSLLKTGLLTTPYDDTNAAPGMIYYYWVRVATPVAMSDFSSSAYGGVPPLPPTGVVASKGNPTNYITVTWSNSANATMYYVYSNSVNNTNTAGLAWTTNGNTYADMNIIRGLTYYYWVQAGNGSAGTSGYSAVAYGGTPPLPPTNITASTNVSSAINIQWSAADYAVMYAVFRNTSTNLPDGSTYWAVSGTNYSDTNAEALVTYYYWVCSTNQYGLSEFSSSTNGWRLLKPPLNVCASKGGYLNKVRVSWSNESAATSYLIYRSVANDPLTATNLYEIASPATNYDDLTVTRGAGYYYWLKSKNPVDVSDFSVGDGVANYGGTVPLPPLNVNATDGVVNNPVTVTWNNADYATGYEVFRMDSYTPPLPLTVPFGYAPVAPAPTYSDTAARPGQRYYYWVKATNQFGHCDDFDSFDTGYRPLAPPSAISASDGVSADHLFINWSISDNASSYELWRGTNSNLAAALMLVNAVPTNTYDDTDSVPGVLYYYWVKAKTTQFVSDFSAWASGSRALRQVDIGVSDMVFLPTRMAVVGSPAAVSFRVTNHGVQDMAEPNAQVAYNFFISSNSVYGDPDLKWMGGTNVSIPLAVGNSSVVVLPKAGRDSLAVPTVLPGWYYIFVNIQHAAPTKWLDPNLANNTVVRNGGAIKISSGQPAGLLPVNDYNGDGYTDMAMYQESTGTWQIWYFGAQGLTMAGYGGPGFKAVPSSDYDGDGKTDLAVYKEATGTWKIWVSSGGYAMASVDGCGGPGFDPVPRDYDGDGKADPAVYQASTGTWRIWLSGSGYSLASAQGAGGASWQAVPDDYDGDGKADPAIYQESTGTWRVWRSSWKYASITAEGLGGPGYLPVVADYDLDGIMDPAVFQASTGTWRIWLSASDYAEASVQGAGNSGTVAVPGDYDGDGLTDPAVYWNAFGMWRMWLSSEGYQQTDILAWPGAGFLPVWP